MDVMNHPEQSVSEKTASMEVRNINQLLLESPAIVYALDPEPPYSPRYVSENSQRIIGYSPEECMETPDFWKSNLHPEDRNRIFKGLQQLFVTENHLHQYRFRAKNGAWLWIEDRIRVVRDAQNRPIELVGSWLDVTSRIGSQTEEENILKSTQFGFWVVTERGQILDVNESYCSMSGYTREELQQMRVNDLDVETKDADIQKHACILKKKGIDAFESIHRRKDGSFFDVFVHIYYAYSHKWGSKVAYVFIIDISIRKDMERKLRESEQRHRALVSSSHDAIMTLNPPSWEFASCNPATLKLFGVKTESEFCTLKLWELSPEKQSDGESSRLKAKKMIDIALEKGVNFFEWTHRRLHGASFISTVLLSRITMNDQEFLQATVRDISVEKKAEKQLKEQNKTLDDLVKDRTFKLMQSQIRTRQIIRNALDAIVTMDSDGIISEWNAQAEKTFGWERTEVLGKVFYETVLSPSWCHVFEIGLRTYLKFGRSNTIGCRLETRGLRKNSESFPMEMSITEVSTDGKRRFSVFLRDISVRKAAEQNLKNAKKSNEVLLRMSNRLTMAISPREAGLAILQTIGEILPWDSSWICIHNPTNGKWERLCAFDRIEGSIKEVYQEKGQCCNITQHLKNRIEKGSILIQGEENQPGVDELLKSGTNKRSASLLFAPIHSSAKLIGIISLQSYQAGVFSHEDRILLMHIANQCSGALTRIQSMAHLASTQKRLASVWESSMDGMRLTDANGEILHVNQAFASIMGKPMDELIGKPFHCIYHPSQTKNLIKLYHERFSNKDSGQRELVKWRLWNNQSRTFELSISYFHDQTDQLLQLTIFRDITEKEEFQRFNRQAQRLESLGLLAGGIAHDLNNALAPISMSIEMLKARHPESGKMLGIIESSSRRGSEMVRRLTTFSKGEEGQRENLSSQSLIEEISNWIRTTFPKNIDLHIRQHVTPCQVFGDRTQLHQVLLNLCVNARDAMPKGGDLTIETSMVQLENPPPICHPNFQPGRYVSWCVSDTGCGISEKVMEHIFDPYFTTKGPEKGTGLGLSILLGIVTSHQGGLSVRSELGQGTSFVVYLPIPTVEKSREPMQVDPVENRSFAGMTILLVDDEKSVLEAMEQVLGTMHMTVLTSSSGEGALACLEKNKNEIEVVITDMHMPVMNGLKLTHEIRKSAPKLPIIVASGLLNPETNKAFREMGVKTFLHKPFTELDLIRALSSLP